MKEKKYIDIYEVGPDVQRVKEHRAKYVKYFIGCEKVLDIGCGRGAFLELLKENNIKGIGLDTGSEMVSICQGKGFMSFQSDAISFLKDKIEEYDGIFCGHIIEHLYPNQALELICLSYKALRKDGILLIITPNIEDIKVITGKFWMDLSHVRPYPLLLLERLLEHNGFKVLEKGEDSDNELRFLPFWKRMPVKLLNIFRKRLIGNYWYRGDTFIVGKK